MKAKYLIYILGLLFFTACEDEPERKEASTYPVSGEWYVHEYYGGDADPYGPYHLQIFNTAFSKDSVWIDNIYDDGVKVKAPVNGTSFNVEDAIDISGGYGKATVLNSKIIDNDSIYFEVILYNYDEETDEYTLEGEFYIAGRRWTGLEGADH